MKLGLSTVLHMTHALADSLCHLAGQQKSSTHHTIIKVKFLSKNSILTNPQHFHEFFTQNIFDNFSREIKVVNS